MAKVVKKIGKHTLEATFSSWTGMAKITLDGKEIYSKFVLLNDSEIVQVDDTKQRIKFSGIFTADVTIDEVCSCCL